MEKKGHRMIYIQSRNPNDLYLKTFNKVYSIRTLKDDPKNYKDTSAVLCLVNYDCEDKVALEKHTFTSVFDYDKYIRGGNGLMEIEIDHYNKEIIKSNKLKKLVSSISRDRYSKRLILNLWDDKVIITKNDVPCVIYISFRYRNKELDMTCHMRANDAYKLLLIDLHIMTAVHRFVCTSTNLAKGNYYHFVDSLHFYKRDIAEIRMLYRKLNKK